MNEKPKDHANEYATQGLFAEQLWQEVSKKQPMRWAKSDAELFTREFIRVLMGAMGSGYTLDFPNFGLFRVVSTNAMKRGVPKKPGTSRTLPPRCKVIFCPAKKLKRMVSRLNPERYPRGKTRAERGVNVKTVLRRAKDPT